MTALASRLIVAAVLLPVVFGAVWLGGWWLFGLAIVGGCLALHELWVMARGLRPLALAGFAGLILIMLGAQLGGHLWLLGGVMATVALAFILFLVSSMRQSATGSFAITLFGPVWVGGGLAHLLLLRDAPDGRLLLVAVLLAVFADDTAAFFVGRAIGRHKLAPSISPGKSIEGFIAGTIAGVAVAFFALYEQGIVEIWESLVFGVAVALAATLGDLFESAVKRDLGVKDSGSLLAGHGGMLDRLDALLWAGPAAVFALLALT